MDIQKVPYTRIITPAPRRPIENAVPLFGSYSGMFHTFDIRGVKKPFGDLPFPTFLTDIRITDTLRCGTGRRTACLPTGNFCRWGLCICLNTLRTALQLAALNGDMFAFFPAFPKGCSMPISIFLLPTTGRHARAGLILIRVRRNAPTILLSFLLL